MPYLLKGNFGLERETMRVDSMGRPAQTAHPFSGSSRISRDFSENQMEFITDVWDSPEKACQELVELHSKAQKKMLKAQTGKEYLWPFSNPPKISGDDDNPVALFSGDSRWKTEYRKYLKKKYGSRLMLYSGVHVNFSFAEEFLTALYDECCIGFEDRTSFVNHVYLDLNAWGTRYSWLVVYLMAASPIYDGSFNGTKKGTIISKYASPRSSKIGYWNEFDPILDYTDLYSYVNSIKNYVIKGDLLYPAELYYPVRIKPKGNYDLDTLMMYGVDHIEFRVVDCNPFQMSGVCIEDVKFIHILMIYLLFKDDKEFTAEEQVNALNDMKTAALLDDNKKLSNGISIRENAERELIALRNFFNDKEKNQEVSDYIEEAISYQFLKLKAKGRYADQVIRGYSKDYQKNGLKLAKKYAEELNDLLI